LDGVALAAREAGEIGNSCVVAGLVAGPSVSVGIAGFGVSEFANELGWSALAERVEEAVPVGDMEWLYEPCSTVGEDRSSAKVGEWNGAGDGVASSLWLRAGEPIALGSVPELALSGDEVVEGPVVFGVAGLVCTGGGEFVDGDFVDASVGDDAQAGVAVEDDGGVGEDEVVPCAVVLAEDRYGR
jgi:hypothetical protein